jgi:gluconolactonase
MIANPHIKKSYLISPLLLMSAFLFSSCKPKEETKPFGTIERLDPGLNAIMDEDAVIEVIAQGLDWTEGPLWIAKHNMLLFSDIPPNKVYKWTEEKGVEEYLMPSGYTGITPSKAAEPGSNGLVLRSDGKLVLCQHGDRRISLMVAPIEEPAPVFTPIADEYEGKKFNSPNDAVYRSNGDLFFTDPPYGLPDNVNDSTKEIPFQGVYKVTPSGEVTLLVDSLTRPNGIGLTPDEKTLVVANSDPEKAVWYAFEITPGDSLANGRILHDVTFETSNAKGLPDGLKFDHKGNLFATGPGGIWIFSPSGTLLGRIRLSDATSNCALADDDKTLYITNDDNVLRIKMRK